MGKVIQAPFAILFLTTGASACSGVLPSYFKAVYADMHDGDKKEITISGSKMTIKPSGNNEKWEIPVEWDEKLCKGTVNFDVPGKPNPPPVSLTATLWLSDSSNGERKTEFEFTDPSGTLPAGPLNRWVQLGSKPLHQAPSCPTSLKAVYADMHDGDKKEIEIEGTSMTIKPSGNDQTWVVKAQIEAKSCSALIDFNVPGKPNPPPVKLTATLWEDTPAGSHEEKTEYEFTDPSGKLAASDFPLNHWVEISRSVLTILQ